jgi:hypothetical protein
MVPQQRADVVSFIGLILAYGWFAATEFNLGFEPDGLWGRALGFYIVTAVAMAILQAIAGWVFGKAPGEQREREREIAHSSGRNAYVAMLSVMWAVPFLLGLPYGLQLAMVACVAAMGLAELVRYGSRLLYRGLGCVRNQRALTG